MRKGEKQHVLTWKQVLVSIWYFWKVTNTVKLRNEQDSNRGIVETVQWFVLSSISYIDQFKALIHEGAVGYLAWEGREKSCRFFLNIVFYGQLCLISYYSSEVFNNSMLPLIKKTFLGKSIVTFKRQLLNTALKGNLTKLNWRTICILPSSDFYRFGRISA